MQSPAPGQPESLTEGLVRILAPNPSPMTHWGTNSYLVGHDSLCLLDPGPALPAHREALLAAIGGRRVSHILVSHSHLDHSPLAPILADDLHAPVLAFGDSKAGRSAAMTALAASGYLGGGEGVDAAFRPDITLPDGAEIAGDGWTLTAQHTPGHFGNHLCFWWGTEVFSGDHVMGWASSMVSPPDGDLTDFLHSCEVLLARAPTRLWPGHGPGVDDAPARLRWLIAHRRAREAALVEALQDGPATVATLTAKIYTDTESYLLPAAARNVLAHLIDLAGKGAVISNRPPGPEARFELS